MNLHSKYDASLPILKDKKYVTLIEITEEELDRDSTRDIRVFTESRFKHEI